MHLSRRSLNLLALPLACWLFAATPSAAQAEATPDFPASEEERLLRERVSALEEAVRRGEAVRSVLGRQRSRGLAAPICGAIRVGDDLFLPYGVADSSVCFAFVAINDVLAAMR